MSRRLVIGDIHGCVRTFYSMLFDALKIRKKDRLYLLGDYIDRGPDSKGVVDLILKLMNTGYNVFPLRGNHEQMLLDYYNYNDSAWFYNGFKSTLSSFDMTLEEKFDDKYFNFFNNLEYIYIIEDFVLTHAGLNYNSEFPLKDTQSMIWTREDRVDKSKIGGRRLVSGHTPHNLNEIMDSLKKDKIQLDGGCVYNNIYAGMGNLCALDLDSMQLYVRGNIENTK